MACGEVSERIRTLLARMTQAEKIGQLVMLSADWVQTGPRMSPDYLERVRAGRVGSLLNLWGAEAVREAQRLAVEETRLGIPLLMGFDAVHGHRTLFPIPLAETAALDPALWRETAQAAALEAMADGLNLLFAPMLDVARDPRWGRIAEGPGEDPWLATRLARAKIRGFEDAGVAATAKHLAAYGAALAGRDYAEADISTRTLHEVYLPPFRAAVEEGVAALMPAFNTVDGVPLTAHVPILQDLVRGRWGFDGVMVSDYNAIGELIAHGVAGDPVEAAALALRAGVDIDMVADAYEKGLPSAIGRGLVEEALLDQSVLRVLALKERLGLLDDPYRFGRALDPERSVAHRDLARRTAQRSIVLLTNRDHALPLDPQQPRRLALVGPLADAAEEMLGPWAAAGIGSDCVTILEGLRTALPGWTIRHEPGCTIDGEDMDSIEAAVAAAGDADIVILCIGEARRMSGEAASRGRIDLPGRQETLARAVLAAGRPVVALLSSGRPLVLPWLFAAADAVLATWFLGHEAGHAIADVLTGAVEPTGRLPVSWPVDVGQLPIFYGRRRSGRPADPAVHYSSKYLDLPVEPQFPFGHGLGYTRFRLADLRATPAQARPDDTVEITVEVGNDGDRHGEETLLLFSRDPVALVARPVLELRAMAKVALAPGAGTTQAFRLPVRDLAYPGPDLAPLLEPGRIDLLVGTAADESRLLATEITLLGGG